MSWFSFLKPTEKQQISVSDTILKIDDTIEFVQKKVTHSNGQIDTLKKEALAFKNADNKAGALKKLQRAKEIQTSIISLEGQVANLEAQRDALSMQQISNQTVQCMKIANESLKVLAVKQILLKYINFYNV